MMIEEMMEKATKAVSKDMDKKKYGTVNFFAEKRLEDGTVLKASSINPELLTDMFNEFVENATKKKSDRSYSVFHESARVVRGDQ